MAQQFDRGVIFKIEDGAVSDFMGLAYNPTRIVRQRAADFEFHKPPKGLLGRPIYNTQEDWVVSFELFLYTREGGRHDRMIQQQAFLETLLLPTSLGEEPPETVLSFGPRAWVGQAVRLGFTDEEFDRGLTPTRSRVSFSLVETLHTVAEDDTWLRGIQRLSEV